MPRTYAEQYNALGKTPTESYRIGHKDGRLDRLLSHSSTIARTWPDWAYSLGYRIGNAGLPLEHGQTIGAVRLED
jgi:hypothetical protein